MSTKEQQQYLEQQIEQLRKRFKRDSNRHKRLALILKALTVSLAGAVTVLLGWKVHAGATPQFVGNIALALGASITLVSAYEAFFDPRVLWVRETVVVARLTDLQRDLSYATKGAKDDDLDAATLLEFKKKLDAVLDDSLKTWLRLRGQDDQQMRPPAKP